MKIKVCGMKYSGNIKAIQNLEPDFMGFIFYDKSPRCVTENNSPAMLNDMKNTKLVGVFVNSTVAEVAQKVIQYKLDLVQLHGDETVDYVKALFELKIKIIKAFQIKENFTWSNLSTFTPYVEYFLFDTATDNYGGSGLKFNWNQLSNYKEEIPFFLSGGITINDVKNISNLDMPQLCAIDINSKFETKPGMKDINLVKEMINKVRNETKISSK